MQAIILATAERQKLLPLTSVVPTPLLPIVNRPVIGIALELLTRAGIKHTLVSLCHHGGEVMKYVGDGRRWGSEVEYIIQREPLGAAGSLHWAAARLTEPFLVLPADTIIDLDIAAALQYHQQHGGAATLVLHRASPGYPAGLVRCDPSGKVCSLGGEDTGSLTEDWYATEAYIFEPRVLEYLTSDMHDCYGQLLPTLLANGEAAYGYQMEGYWNPLHTLAAYQEAQHVFLYSAYNGQATNTTEQPRVRFPSIDGREIAPGIWIGPNSSILSSASLVPPVCIGSGCWIGTNAEVGPGTVIGPGVIVDDEATVRTSTVLERTYIGRLVNSTARIVNGGMLIDPSSGEHTLVVDAFLLATLPEAPDRRWMKDLANRFLALLLLVLALPLLILIGLSVYISTRGRLLHRSPHLGWQKPVALNTTPESLLTFDLLSFALTRRDGTRTRLGQWLQRWELDRLPGLWNVVRGDMALVGVKPITPVMASKLYEEWQQKRFDCPAGFTGLWYIQTDEQSDPDEWLVADAYYAATNTLRGDLYLLMMTPLGWFNRTTLRRRQRMLHSSTVQSRSAHVVDRSTPS